MTVTSSRARVFVVEDEIIVARDIEELLRDHGYTPAGHALRGEDAIGMLGESRPDLVLMDIQLAGEMDGITTAQAIRTQLDLPVVFLTAYSADETLARAKLAEPYGYVLKPFTERELCTVMEMALYKYAAEKRLRETEYLARRQLQRILDNVAAYSISFDQDRDILHASSGLRARAGYEDDSLTGKPISLLLGATQTDAVNSALAAGDGDIAIRELRARDGSFWPVHMVLSQPAQKSSHQHHLLLGRDRQAEVAAEAKLDLLRQSIRHARELLDTESEQRQNLERAFLDIAEREQARIGHELHDDVGQQLAGIAFLGKALQQRLERAGREEAADAAWIARLLAQTLDSLRAISRDLSPGGMESGDLEKSLRSLCARCERLHGISCRAEVNASDALIGTLTPTMTLNLFRVAQEAVNNALRHGNAQSIELSLRLNPRQGSLTIRDNGQGFDVRRDFEGIGLRNIRMRTRAISGRLRLASGPSGTLLAVHFLLSGSAPNNPDPGGS